MWLTHPQFNRTAISRQFVFGISKNTYLHWSQTIVCLEKGAWSSMLKDVCDSQQKLDHACSCFAFVSVRFMCRCWVKKTNKKTLQQYDYRISKPKVFRVTIAKVIKTVENQSAAGFDGRLSV